MRRIHFNSWFCFRKVFKNVIIKAADPFHGCEGVIIPEIKVDGYGVVEGITELHKVAKVIIVEEQLEGEEILVGKILFPVKFFQP